MSTFGERLKFLRTKKQVTQKQVADYFLITMRAYQNYEINKSMPNASLLIELADYFDVSLDYLVGRSDDDTPISYVSDYENDFRRILRTLLPQIDVSAIEFFYLDTSELERIAYSNGHISLDRVCKIANLLGLSLDTITGYSNTNPIVKFDFQKKIES